MVPQEVSAAEVALEQRLGHAAHTVWAGGFQAEARGWGPVRGSRKAGQLRVGSAMACLGPRVHFHCARRGACGALGRGIVRSGLALGTGEQGWEQGSVEAFCSDSGVTSRWLEPGCQQLESLDCVLSLKGKLTEFAPRLDV